VFALLGVSQEAGDPKLAPDYREDPEDTYKRVGKWMAEKGFVPLLLEFVPLEKTPGWPSWIPRWHEPGTHTVHISSGLRMSHTFRAAGESVQDFLWQPDHSLLARGIIFDTIANLASREDCVVQTEQLGNPHLCSSHVFKSLWRVFKMLSPGPNQPYVTGEPDHEVVYKLSVCDQYDLRAKRAPKEYARGLAVFLCRAEAGLTLLYRQQPQNDVVATHYLGAIKMVGRVPATNDSLDDDDSWANEFMVAAFRHYSQNVQFKTEKGYIGQVIGQAIAGDKIALLSGCDVPVILRPVENGAYVHVTTCYLHGIMYGEMWNNEEVHDIRVL
jgi:hypothetical protein